MTLHRREILNMCDELMMRDMKASWMVNTRVDLVDDVMLGKMAKAGGFNIFFGVESDNSRVSNEEIRNNISGESIFNAILLSNKDGIQTNI